MQNPSTKPGTVQSSSPTRDSSVVVPSTDMTHNYQYDSGKNTCMPPDNLPSPVSSANWGEASERKNMAIEARKSWSANEIFEATAVFKTFPDDFLIINDVYLTNVPTTSIHIQSKTDVFVGETLRSRSPIVSSEGREEVMVQIGLLFPPGDAQTKDLRRIMSTILVNPFVYVHSNHLKKSLGMSEMDTALFALESGNIRSTADTVGCIALDLTFYRFNYRPFSKHHYYNAKMFAVASATDLQSGTETSLPVDLPSLQGYEPSSHSLSFIAQESAARLRSAIVGLKMNDKGNVPVNLPSESDPWMYYVDTLLSNAPKIEASPGDYIGFSTREFITVVPPKSENSSKSTLSELLNTQYKEHHELYKIVPPSKVNTTGAGTTSELAIQSSQAGPIRSGAKTKVPAGRRQPVMIHHQHEMRRGLIKIIQLVNDDGTVHPTATNELYDIVKPLAKSANVPNTLNPNVVIILQHIADNFPGRSIIIISGLRPPDKDGKVGAHYHGNALDIKVEGISETTLHQFTRTIPYCGSIQYTSTLGEVHIEASNNLTGWWEVKGPDNTKPILSGKNSVSEVEVASAKDSTKSDIEDTVNRTKATEEARIRQAQDSAAARSQGVKTTAEKVAREVELQKQKSQPENFGEDTAVGGTYVKSDDGHKEWVLKEEQRLTEEYGHYGSPVYYYQEDPTLRNVFYIDHSCSISSDINAQRDRSALKDIVCSAISISFGHRLAPMRCIGQGLPAWQFLGAGNKSGQIVLTFAGEKGKESSRKIKDQIILKSRESARLFGSLIKEAGTVSINHTDFMYGDQNTILALAGIKNIVITGHEEFSSPDGADKHQLVIEFIAQEFAAESFDKRFSVDVEKKKEIIRAVMSHITARSSYSSSPGIPKEIMGSDSWEITPKSDIAIKNSNKGARPWVAANERVPAWVVDIISSAAEATRKINDSMPPTSWKIDGSRTWKDVYKDWGAGEFIKGRVENIAFGERATSIKAVEGSRSNINGPGLAYYPAEADSIDADERNGIFKYNGGSSTNKIHYRKFEEWLNAMEDIVRRVKEFLSDEEPFNKYFNGLGKDLLSNITIGFGECYDDMQLPVIPGTAVPVPPEFFVYDDSHEDPFLANLGDPANMEVMLKKQYEYEMESIRHYVTGCVCGGSYLSKNFPKIREQRLSEIDRFKDEEGFLHYFSLASNGAKTWEPLYWRADEVGAVGSGSTKSWMGIVADAFGDKGKSESEQTLGYLTSVVKLSSYLNDARHWSLGTSEVDADFVKNMYGEAADQIAFGPSAINAQIDSVNSGSAPSGEIMKAAHVQEYALSVARNTNSTVELPGMSASALPDGSVTVGRTEEEKESMEPSLGNQVNEMLSDVPLPVRWAAAVIGAPLAGATAGIVGTLGWLGLTAKNMWDTVSAVADVSNDAIAASVTNAISKTSYMHEYAKKFTEAAEAEHQAKAATRFALGKRASDLSMRRAYPTFKIYFIEDDTSDTVVEGGKVLRAFDDFYSYSAIQEIRVTRSRKVAGDLAIIRMTNVGGLLLRRRFGKGEEENINKRGQGEKQGIFADTDKEHPFESMVLQDGVKVQIRLGYAANPDNLTTVFLGQIVEISPSEDTKVLEIMCQGYGAELDHVELGPLENGPVFFSTQQALSAAIIQDSIANFGRQDRYNQDNATIARHAWTGGKAQNLMQQLSPSNIIGTWLDEKLDRLFQRYKFLNYPQDDNIYAPPPHAYTTSWERFWNNAAIFRPIKQTAWEIFKEHELRHPGYVSMAVPYGHEPRMTMFFGSRMQHYWSKPPTPLEKQLAESAAKDRVKLGNLGAMVLSKEVLSKLNALATSTPSLASAMLKDIMSFGKYNYSGFAMGEVFGRYVPFRNYLYLDSDHHILKNEIRTSVDDTYNEVEIYYSSGESSILEGSLEERGFFEGVVDAITGSEDKKVAEGIEDIVNGYDGVLAVKLDENIPEYAIRSTTEAYPSCVTDDMARRYAQGLFARHLRDAYKGELTIIGDDKVKPYDVCFVNDASINMYGPVEVEAVTHIFSRDNGFISVITPDLCLEVNDYFTMSSFDMTATACGMVWGDASSFIGSAAIGGPPALGAAVTIQALRGVGFLAAWAGVKFGMWTQDGSPVIATPLSLGGKPFLSVSLGPKRVSMFTSLFGKWTQYWDDLGDAWRKFDLSEEIFSARLDMTQGILGVFGTGARGGGQNLPPAKE